MLYIETDKRTIEAHGWKLTDYDEDSETALLVQADGIELHYIQTYFTGIPSCAANVQKWRGAWAQFIAEHYGVR